MEPLLQVIDLNIDYYTKKGPLRAIRNLNFQVEPGQIVGMVGESGCGKSTVASALMRLLSTNGRINSGKIIYKNTDIVTMTNDQIRAIRGQEISMIFQNPMTSLNPVFSIEQQMVDSILANSYPGNKMNRKIALDHAIKNLRSVEIPDVSERIKGYPFQFSGGMCQRIMIAMALQANPSLLIADEPTSALDVTLQAQISQLLLKLRDEKETSILYITHDLGIVAQLCDQVIVLYAGGMVESGNVFDIFKHPLHPYTQALLRSHPSYHLRQSRLATIPGRVPDLIDLPRGCKFAERCSFAKSICYDHDPQMTAIENRHVYCHAYSSESKKLFAGSFIAEKKMVVDIDYKRKISGEYLVKIEGLGTYFDRQPGFIARLKDGETGVLKAVNNVNINVRKGEIFGVVGESGSGKTTLARSILRLVEPSVGTVIINDHDITKTSQSKFRDMRSSMQMIFQDPISSLSPRKSVKDLLLEPFKVQKISVDRTQKVNELLETVSLSAEQADKFPHQLSGGQARRVGIARALALRPELLIADEPTAGLDISVAAGILNLLKDLSDNYGQTIIIITHDLNTVRFIADRIAVMYLGKILEIGETDHLFSNPSHPYTEALMSSIAVPNPEIREKDKQLAIKGEIPSPQNPPSGCVFHTRCVYQKHLCVDKSPQLSNIGSSDSYDLVACHYPLR